MNTPRKEVGVATYLLGNGPYRSPGPIDLQWMRIHQYRRLLGSKYGGAWSPVHDYTDINYPRAETNIDEQADEGRRGSAMADGALWIASPRAGNPRPSSGQKAQPDPSIIRKLLILTASLTGFKPVSGVF